MLEDNGNQPIKQSRTWAARTAGNQRLKVTLAPDLHAWLTAHAAAQRTSTSHAIVGILEAERARRTTSKP